MRRWTEFSQVELLVLFEALTTDDGEPIHDDELSRKLVNQLRNVVRERQRQVPDWTTSENGKT